MVISNRLKICGVAWLLLAGISVYSFLTREQHENYIKQVDYSSLYTASGNERLQKWKRVAAHFSEADRGKAKKFTAAYAGVAEGDPDFDKMVKIGSWLQRTLRHCPRGQPTASFEALSPIAKLEAARQAPTPVWCGTFGELFLLLCAANDINCRYIEPISGTRHHIVNEAYISELKQWVLTDLMYDALYCKNSQGKILNTADLVLMNANKDSSDITRFTQQSTDSFRVEPVLVNARLWDYYLNDKTRLLFYHTLNKARVYSPREKIKRYIYPAVWFEVFSLTPVSNAWFYWRSFALVGAFLATILFIYFFFHDRGKKYQEKFRR